MPHRDVPAFSTMKINAENEEETRKLNSVSSYLLLLSVKEIYLLPEYAVRLNVSQELNRVEMMIQQLRRHGCIKLEANTNIDKFFNWFEEEFSKSYTQVSDVVSEGNDHDKEN